MELFGTISAFLLSHRGFSLQRTAKSSEGEEFYPVSYLNLSERFSVELQLDFSYGPSLR